MAKASGVRLDRRLMEELMFGVGRARRFTQDTPVLPDVWMAYADCLDNRRPTPRDRASEAHPPIKVLLVPFRDAAVGEVRLGLRERLLSTRQRAVRESFRHHGEAPTRIVYNQTTLAAALYFEDLVRGVLPMTEWWRRLTRVENWQVDRIGEAIEPLALAVEDPEHPQPIAQGNGVSRRPSPGLLWMIRVVGALSLVLRGEAMPWRRVPTPAAVADRRPDPGWVRIVRGVADLVAGIETGSDTARIHSVSLNRDVTPTISRSVMAVKADAARQLFSVSCADLAWAVIDSGIDASHPAFRARDKDGSPYAEAFPEHGGRRLNRSRVVETYDFSQIDRLLDPDSEEQPDCLVRRRAEGEGDALGDAVGELNRALARGRHVDWSQIVPLLRIPQGPAYRPPAVDHGTHVAGILAGDWRRDDPDSPLDEDLVGVCRDLRLFDLRVLDDEGHGDEFGVMAALQFVRYLNAAHDYMVVHGTNLSLSIPHDVANYACGRTPICDECERVVAGGVVVVAAAGNQGYRRYRTADDVVAEAYNSSSITDPGNAELVITVGATHRYRAHLYGVSYFSSRGPTGDGRAKPDLVAPGEKVTAPLPGELYGLKDGTSMAAPHVSGGAALLMARHLELIGQPQRIKQILCATATDLGRERYFQGAGMLDVLRAMQSI